MPVPSNTGPRVLLYRDRVLLAANDGKASGWQRSGPRRHSRYFTAHPGPTIPKMHAYVVADMGTTKASSVFLPVEVLRHGMDSGITYFDTTFMYGSHESENVVPPDSRATSRHPVRLSITIAFHDGPA